MSKYNTPIAKLGKRVLIANKDDVIKIGSEKAMEVIVQQWDLETNKFEGEFVLEELLKFNPWEDILDKGEIEKIKEQLGLLNENRELRGMH